MVKIVFDSPKTDKTNKNEENAFIPVQITQNAAEKVKEILKKKGKDTLMLRLTIKGGGCSGYSYYFDLTEEKNEEDFVVFHDTLPDIHMLVDPNSYDFVKGAIVDYKETLESAQFVVENPNAASSCGCGNSFSVK